VQSILTRIFTEPLLNFLDKCGVQILSAILRLVRNLLQLIHHVSLYSARRRYLVRLRCLLDCLPKHCSSSRRVGSRYFGLLLNTRPDLVVFRLLRVLIRGSIRNSSSDNCSSISESRFTFKTGISDSGIIVPSLSQLGNGVSIQSLTYSEGNV